MDISLQRVGTAGQGIAGFLFMLTQAEIRFLSYLAAVKSYSAGVPGGFFGGVNVSISSFA